MVLFIIHAYIYILLYEKLTGECGNYKKWLFVFIFGIGRYLAEPLPFMDQLHRLVILTVLIIYSLCLRSKNSNLENLSYAVIAVAIDDVFHVVTGSAVGLAASLLKVEKSNWGYIAIADVIVRLLFIMFLTDEEKLLSKLKKARALPIIRTISTVVLTLDIFLGVAFSTKNVSFGSAAIACIYLSILFSVLWLMDHYKMAKIQDMYADDNRQMSQKLHRSKEIIPMIARYASSLEETQDEELRKKLETICRDYGKELGGAEMNADFFETTGIDLADLLLGTKIRECSEQDIELNVFVNTRIDKDMKRMDISDAEIARLLGDLLRNAIHAVSDLEERMILLMIARDENDRVLIKIYDSGIPFPSYILDHFGERGNTTWGTGNGLADLMGTVNRVHASIEVNTELAPEDVFTKEISICFDGKENLNILQKEKNKIPVQGLIPNLE